MTNVVYKTLKGLIVKRKPSECTAKSREYYLSVFRKTSEFPSYAKLAEKTPIIGVWDDHDFGRDNAGSEFCGKDLVRDIYLDFINEPSDSERRLQTGTALF